MSDPVLDAVRESLDRDPSNHALWIRYAELLAAAGQPAEAVAAFKQAIGAGADARACGLRMVQCLRESGGLDEALIRAETMLEAADDPALRLELARVHLARGSEQEAREQYAAAVAADASLRDAALAALAGATDTPAVPAPPDGAPPATPAEGVSVEAQPGEEDLSDWADQFDWGGLRVTFSDVAGLEEAKRQIHLRVVAPVENPELYQAFRRTGGGGLLLYGPPGCGKTYLARATAGEVGASFVSVGIHEVLDRWLGESEKAIHGLFEHARHNAPCVLFFDEFDALGTTRGSGGTHGWKSLVNQLLQEMDGISGPNDDVLVFASTNAPWNVDSAFRRPGRFDRLIFVPPPDQPARAQILQSIIGKVPGGDRINVAKLAKRTELMTGADLTALAERAAEHALSRSLASGSVEPVTVDDFERELAALRSSASEWIATARNYARYSNEGGQYDELATFLKRHKKW